MAVLSLNNVKKSYKLGDGTEFPVLKGINVSFEKGELVSIIGESGSGKSTLMNIIGGLDSKFEGEVLVDGKNIGSFTEKELDIYRKNKIGFIFQSFNLVPHLTILDNVALALTLSNVKRSEQVERAKELLERTVLPISEIAIETGYSNTAYFTKMFKKYTNGVTPREYRKGLGG